MKKLFCYSLVAFCLLIDLVFADIALYWWQPYQGTNFGDELSAVIVEKIVGKPIRRANPSEFKLLSVGSIIQFANTGDVVWGSGMNGKDLHWKSYPFQKLDVRAVRGPLTQRFLKNLGIEAPSVFGDPALLLPYLFPEYKAASSPGVEYIVIPHMSEIALFSNKKNVVSPTDPWEKIVEKIIQSKFVISSSLHGIIVAEAFGIPARFLRVTSNEPDFKYLDYYLGTGRQTFTPAKSIKEAIELGGEPPPVCDLERLVDAFPFDCFTDGQKKIDVILKLKN